MRNPINTAVMVVALCTLAVTLALAEVTTATHNSYALRPCSICKEIKFETEEECRKAGQAEARRVGETRTTGHAVYTCITRHNVIATFKPNPPAVCGDRPGPDEQRSQTCPAGTVGTWLQDSVWTLQPYPECWTQGDWTPTSPPPGMCAPVACPDAPASQTRTIQCPAGTTGTYTERSTSTVGPLPACTVTTTWEAIPPGNGACIPISQPHTPPLFMDRFEYDIPRAGNADLFRQHGYTGVKAENATLNRSGSGYIYTQFVEALGSRALVLESRPTMKPAPAGFPYTQTDYYLQLGSESGSGTAIPANAWIQFWTYATPDSRFSTRDKVIYPCRGAYPCTNLTWLFMWGSGGYEGTSAPAGGRYLALEGWGADRDTRVNDGDDRKLFQNVSRTPLLAGRQYQVRLHLDISGPQGVYQAWIREPGEIEWRKLAEWIGGVTPNFSWPISNRTGYNIVRIPTTVNAADNTVYIDDFVIADSQAALPN